MLALCLAREDAVEGWRELLGPKDVSEAAEKAPDRYGGFQHIFLSCRLYVTIMYCKKRDQVPIIIYINY